MSKDIEFKTHDNHPMHGRLFLPETKAPPRAIVVSVQTAEGATIDMKRPLGKGKTFNYFDLYRDKLTAMNIGHFSYEGRGIEMGTEPPRYEKIDWEVYNTSTLDNKVKDVISAIETLRQQDGLANTPIYLLGASEGTLIAAEAASRRPEEVKGLVLYGVLVTNLRETFRYIVCGGDFLKYRKMDGDGDNAISP
ncbi:MAG: alpha/beta hydrolase, partial [Verrucomicrobiota bacterium]